MKIPANSTFTKEISKQFKQIFHRDMTLGGLQDLQEELNLINPVDTYLAKQVSQIRKEDEKTNLQTSGTIRQEYTKRKSLVWKVSEVEREKQKVTSSWTLLSLNIAAKLITRTTNDQQRYNRINRI